MLASPITMDVPVEFQLVNLRRQVAARYLTEVHGIPVQPATLAKWFCVSSDGPPALKSGRIPLYPRAELDAWAKRRLGRLRSSTSDKVAA
jgi:hypothetical protein